ncbi:MAG TPA: Re/Si-specific NAD(P)(+) transhydrogenase subunit alpha [Planctomycetaceae bacterium]|nr:Re/Si-specific NAD(P)(+) transhydrogenase subunit alpha [Planctomycetaceae bacterium]
MKVGVIRESFPGERRVAVVPGSVTDLKKAGLEVVVEAGAGAAAGFGDEAYRQQGASVVASRQEVFAQADVLLQVRAAGANPEEAEADVASFRDGQILISLCNPLGRPEWMRRLAERGVTVFALELLPRTTRAQSMDVLSSMATVSGYKAVLLAASALPRMFPMLMTAAGTIAPARVFVVGAGVAGLQAIATAKRLGAVVQAYDIRPAAKEEAVSLGAKFVELELETEEAEQKGGYAKEMGEEFYRRQRELMGRVLGESDVVITTAAVPGKKAPVLITEEMVEPMATGSVIVDLAAEQGGNCELTRPNETIVVHGVTIIGAVNLPATVPYHASQMYSRNITTFLRHLLREGTVRIDEQDEITIETLVTRGGDVVNGRVREVLGLEPVPTASSEKARPSAPSEPSKEAGTGSG